MCLFTFSRLWPHICLIVVVTFWRCVLHAYHSWNFWNLSKSESNCSHARNSSTLTDTRCYMGTTLLIPARTTIASQASHTFFAGTLTGCIITWLARWSNCVTWTCYIYVRRKGYKLWGPLLLLLLCDYR